MFKAAIGFFASWFLGGLLSAQALDPDANLVLATRGDVAVRMADVDAMLESARPEQRPDIVSSPARVEQLIDTRLLSAQLARRGREQKLDQDPEVQRRLAFATEKAFGEIVLDVLVKRADSGGMEKLAKETYAGKKADFVQAGSWNVRHLLVKAKENEPDDAFKMRSAELYQESIAAPADFEALVKLKSEDPSVSQNQGAFTLGRDSEFAEEFLAASLKLSKPQQFAPLTKTQFGYHIIQLLEKVEQRQLTFTEARPQIMASLNEGFRDRVKTEILSDLRSADPKYVEENIRKLVVRYDLPVQAAPIDAPVPVSPAATELPK